MLNQDYFEIATAGDEDDNWPLPWDGLPFLPGREVLDVGCGSGLQAIGLARRGWNVLALEPDDVARAYAIAHALADERARELVSILPHDVVTAPLPTALGGALVKHVLYLMDEPTRRGLWQQLSRHLLPGAGVLLSRIWPTRGHRVAWELVGQDEAPRLGRFSYRRWFGAELEGDRTRFTNRFEILDGEQVVFSEDQESLLTPLTEEQALAELPSGAFEVREVDERWLALIRC